MSKRHLLGIDSGHIFQVVAVLTSTFNAISDGMQYGWTAPAIPILSSPNSPIKIQESDVVWIENIAMIGSIAGVPLTIYSVNKFGRKASILLAASQSFLAWLIMAFTTSVEVLYAARFLSGVAADVAFVAGPMYIAEIAHHKIRGFLGAMEYIMMLVGALVVYSVVPYVTIRTSSLVGASFLVLQFLTFPFMPESPYYYLIKGEEGKAKDSLQRLRRCGDVDVELSEIAAAVKRQISEKGRLVDLFLIDTNRKGLLIMFVLSLSQHFSGFSVILMNLHSILIDANTILILDPNTVGIIFCVVMLVACASASSIIDLAGRRILLITSSLLTAVTLLILAAYFTFKNKGFDITRYTWIPVASIMIYAIVYKYGLGMVPIVIGGELFSSSVKAVGMTATDLIYVVASIISVYVYQIFGNKYGNHAPFFIFSASCVFAAIFVYYYVPETKGKTLEEIQIMLQGPPKKRDVANIIEGTSKL